MWSWFLVHFISFLEFHGNLNFILPMSTQQIILVLFIFIVYQVARGNKITQINRWKNNAPLPINKMNISNDLSLNSHFQVCQYSAKLGAPTFHLIVKCKIVWIILVTIKHEPKWNKLGRTETYLKPTLVFSNYKVHARRTLTFYK